MTDPMIVATALSKMYEGGETRQVAALHDLSLTIERGKSLLWPEPQHYSLTGCCGPQQGQALQPLQSPCTFFP